MIKVESNHCQIVRDSITGEKAVDDETFDSLAVLTERLERLKKLDGAFSNVAFSSAVERLMRQEVAYSV